MTTSEDVRAIRELMQEIAADRPSILDGTISCRWCAALVLDENEGRHRDWHNTLAAELSKGTP